MKTLEAAPWAPRSTRLAEIVNRVSVEWPNLAAYMETGTPVRIGPEVISIAFSSAREICREILAKEDNHRYVQDICRDVYGPDVVLKYLQRVDPVDTPSPR